MLLILCVLSNILYLLRQTRHLIAEIHTYVCICTINKIESAVKDLLSLEYQTLTMTKCFECNVKYVLANDININTNIICLRSTLKFEPCNSNYFLFELRRTKHCVIRKRCFEDLKRN